MVEFRGECICDHDRQEHAYGRCAEPLTEQEVDDWEAKGVLIPPVLQMGPGVTLPGHCCPCTAGWVE